MTIMVRKLRLLLLTWFSSREAMSARADPFPPTSTLLPHSLSFKFTTKGNVVSDLRCGSFKTGSDSRGNAGDGPEYLPK
jgi:hypothetical protein